MGGPPAEITCACHIHVIVVVCDPSRFQRPRVARRLPSLRSCRCSKAPNRRRPRRPASRPLCAHVVFQRSTTSLRCAPRTPPDQTRRENVLAFRTSTVRSKGRSYRARSRRAKTELPTRHVSETASRNHVRLFISFPDRATPRRDQWYLLLERHIRAQTCRARPSHAVWNGKFRKQNQTRTRHKIFFGISWKHGVLRLGSIVARWKQPQEAYIYICGSLLGRRLKTFSQESARRIFPALFSRYAIQDRSSHRRPAERHCPRSQYVKHQKTRREIETRKPANARCASPRIAVSLRGFVSTGRFLGPQPVHRLLPAPVY